MVKCKFKYGVDYKFNPDKEMVNMILEGVRKHNGHCPCELVHDETTKCMCKAMREEMKCRCGLYVPVEEGQTE